MRGHLTRASRRLVLLTTTTVVAVAGLGATAAPTLAHDFRVPTTTTLVASPSAIDSSQSTTLTASIKPGLLVGPIGNVKFADSTNGAALGTVKPKLACLLHPQPCVATITVPGSALAAGDNTIVADYSGGLFTKPSSGSTDVFVGTQNTCPAGSTCTTPISSSDGLTSAAITSTAPDTGTETVQAFFDSETLPCTKVSAVGNTLVYSVTNPGGQTKTVSLVFTGSVADAEHALDPNNFGNVCFGATAPFTTVTGKQAVPGPDGLFYGNLPLCDDQDGDDDNNESESGGNLVVPAGTFPCINFVDAGHDTWATYTPASGDTSSKYTESFTTTSSDPKAHG